MKMKIPSIVRSCVGPSPTTDDNPSASSGQRADSSHTPAGPEGLASRSRGSETPQGQRPRKKNVLTRLGKGIMNAPHAIGVRRGLSQSRRAAATDSNEPPESVKLAHLLQHPVPPPRARGTQAPHAAGSNQVPIHSPTQASPAGVNLWDLLDEQGRQQAALAQGPHVGRSPHMSSVARNMAPPPRILNDPPVVQQPVAQPTLVEPPPVRNAEVPPENRQLTPAMQTLSQPHQAAPGPSIAVEPPAHHETPPMSQPQAQPVQASSRRTRVPTSLPRQDSHRSDSSIGSLSTISLGSSNRHVPQDPLPPLVWRSRTLEVTPPETPQMTAPQTPRPPEPTVPPQPERTGLPSRREAFVTAATQALQQMHLPQAGKILANTSLTRELEATANTLLRPLQVAAQTGSTLLQAGTSWLNRPRQSSEDLQRALLGGGVDLSQPGFQELAHAHAVDYGEHAATVLDTALPTVHSILNLGGAGTSMAFGVSRNSGLAAGDALGRVERGAPQATGVRAGPERPAATLQSGTAFKAMGAGAQQWLLGSVTGAVGNLAGQYLAAPLVNLIPRQFAPVDLRAVLPDETVALMNQLQPGAGDTLRKQVQEAQRDVSTINSASNVRLGQIAFDAITAARFAAQGGLPLGVAGQVGIGLAVSSSAGMVIGAVMASRQSVATHAVPDLPTLRERVEEHLANPGSDGAAALAQVPRNAVPLFFPKQIALAAGPQAPRDLETGHGEPLANADAAQRDRLASMRDTAQWAVQQAVRPLAAVGQAWSQSLGSSPLIEPAAPGTDGAITAGRVLQTASNVAASVVNRAGEMAKATLTTSLMSTGSAMLASTTDGPAREFILAMGNAVGIHAAIKPWFDSLVTEIPQGDAAIRAHRERVVNE